MSETAEPATWRIAARVAESMALSLLAGVFVWVLAAMFLRLPLVTAGFAGFLAGGAATMRTFGVTFYDRTRRMRLAGLCAVFAIASWFALDYHTFIRGMRHRQAIADYRASAETIDLRIAGELRELTGREGFPGYVAAAIQEGVPVVGVRLRGPYLLAFWALEFALAIVVAMRWAGGPRPHTG